MGQYLQEKLEHLNCHMDSSNKQTAKQDTLLHPCCSSPTDFVCEAVLIKSSILSAFPEHLSFCRPGEEQLSVFSLWQGNWNISAFLYHHPFSPLLANRTKNETKHILALQKDTNLRLFFSQQDISKLIIPCMNFIEPPLLILVSCHVPLGWN